MIRQTVSTVTAHTGMAKNLADVLNVLRWEKFRKESPVSALCLALREEMLTAASDRRSDLVSRMRHMAKSNSKRIKKKV